MGNALAVVLGLICCLGLAIVGGIILMYNGLITLRGRAENAWSQIDVQLRRRYDLIPNLVETVKGYAKHESQTLEAVIAARNTAMNASTVGEQAVAENALTQTLRSLFALSEAYPDLKANENFLALQEELSGTESMIARSRQFYNDCTMDYNNKIQMFPSNIIAGMCSFTKRDFFQVDSAAERAVPKVSFS